MKYLIIPAMFMSLQAKAGDGPSPLAFGLISAGVNSYTYILVHKGMKADPDTALIISTAATAFVVLSMAIMPQMQNGLPKGFGSNLGYGAIGYGASTVLLRW